MSNGCSGLLATYLASTGQLDLGIIAITAAMLCDSFDGYLARRLGVASDFGTQLDIVADVVSFGVSPAILILSIDPSMIGVIAACAYLCAALWRLAAFSFNADLGYFIGVPSLVAAIVVWLAAIWLPTIAPSVAVFMAIAMLSKLIKVRKHA